MPVTADARLFVFVRLHAAPDAAERVRAATTAVVTASTTEPGCVHMHAFQSVRDERLFFIHSVWADAAAFESHATQAHTMEFIATVDPLLDEPRQVSRTSRFV